MHNIARALPEVDPFFSPYYTDGLLEWARKLGLIDFTIVGNKLVERCLAYCTANNLPVDYQGKHGGYDLVVTCADLIIPGNIRGKKIILVQEGMTDPERFAFHLVKTFPFLPRWAASTSAMGLSNAYESFCVASEGYRDLFIRKGVRPETVQVTGIPNFDNCRRFLSNSFPFKHYVLVCTSDSRETFMHENRRKTIENAVRIANGRMLIFKLHPNENHDRATREIKRYAPETLVYTTGNTDEMIAHCDVLITRFSSTAYVGLALGKEVHSEFDVDELRRLLPLQHGRAAENIADVCRRSLGLSVPERKTTAESAAA